MRGKPVNKEHVIVNQLYSNKLKKKKGNVLVDGHGHGENKGYGESEY